MLELSRICDPKAADRNYHIFYILCAGAPQALKHKLHLSNPDHYFVIQTLYFYIRAKRLIRAIESEGVVLSDSIHVDNTRTVFFRMQLAYAIYLFANILQIYLFAYKSSANVIRLYGITATNQIKSLIIKIYV